jgi:hypothetical protein
MKDRTLRRRMRRRGTRRGRRGGRGTRTVWGYTTRGWG